MIASFGVPAINLDNMTVRRIFEAYRQPDPAAKAALKANLKTADGMQEVTVQMVGVWDTVGSLGIPGIFFNFFNQQKYGFLDAALHPCIVHAYNAVAIDERKAQFKPTFGPMRMEATAQMTHRWSRFGSPVSIAMWEVVIRIANFPTLR